MPTLSAEELKRLSAEVFVQLGTPASAAQCVAHHLVEANLAGHDSHGVMRIPQYVDLIKAGRIVPQGQMQVVHESTATAVVDGGLGFGQVIARDGMLLALEKARGGGVGAVTVRNCSHTGRIGTYTELAAHAGFVGIAMVNSGGAGQSVAPFGGIARRLATNPISIAAPSGGPHPVVLDMASSVAPEGKVRVLFQAGQKLPPGWLVDINGAPSTDAADFYREPGGALQPLGGPVGHKGFILAFMIDILAGLLSGAGCSSADPPPAGDGMLTIALDVKQFLPLAEFQHRVAELADYVRSCPLAPGVERIYAPGEIEALRRARRLREGIFVEPSLWTQIEQICTRLNVHVVSQD